MVPSDSSLQLISCGRIKGDVLGKRFIPDTFVTAQKHAIKDFFQSNGRISWGRVEALQVMRRLYTPDARTRSHRFMDVTLYTERHTFTTYLIFIPLCPSKQVTVPGDTARIEQRWSTPAFSSEPIRKMFPSDSVAVSCGVVSPAFLQVT